MITWNEFLYNFGKIKRAKATELLVVAIATKPKQFTCQPFKAADF